MEQERDYKAAISVSGLGGGIKFHPPQGEFSGLGISKQTPQVFVENHYADGSVDLYLQLPVKDMPKSFQAAVSEFLQAAGYVDYVPDYSLPWSGWSSAKLSFTVRRVPLGHQPYSWYPFVEVDE